MSFDLERLYSLLPAIHRIRDVEVAAQAGGLLTASEQSELAGLRVAPPPLSAQDAKRLHDLEARAAGGPLKALLSIIAEQVAVLEANLEQLYDDQFIETCAEWVVPYIGDLVGARGLQVFPSATFSQRSQVANTIAYRRRKGTAAVIEQLARDVTDWDASVVDYFKQLATTQYTKHLRPQNLAIADLRNQDSLDSIGSPFDSVARTGEVRRIQSGRGQYNIRNVGVFLYRLGAFQLNSAAYRLDARRYLFSPIGKDTALFNNAARISQITTLSGRTGVTLPIGRRLLDESLDTYYGKDKDGQLKSMLINVNGNDVVGAGAGPGPTSPPGPQLADLIQVCDLSDVKDSGGNVTGWAHKPASKIAIDPVLGRIAFPENSPAPVTVHTSYHCGFSAEMGGGNYERVSTFSAGLKPLIRVPKDRATISAALAALASTGGVVEIDSDETFVETPAITVPASKTIELRGADGRRPVLAPSGAIQVIGGDESAAIINGLLINGGSITVPLKAAGNQDNKLHTVTLVHCTLVPGPTLAVGAAPARPGGPRMVVEAAGCTLQIRDSIIGPLRAAALSAINLQNSIVDATDETEMAIGGPSGPDAGAPLTISNTTIIGKVHTVTMQLASNSIFLSSLSKLDALPGPVIADRLQQGCVRFSYIPPGSVVPRPHQCQPRNLDDAGRVRPIFTSLKYGDAGYCQLSGRSAIEITQGGDDGAEMGAFHDLFEPQRESNIRARLDEFLRFGLEAGIFYAS
ncbi:MAG TPA: hypothetical protein VKJ45_17370 [Blastocatellia bacterium]|nr:hypothetical protein [Blastocatellia bacterium]